MVIKKTRRCNKARFQQNTLKKTPSSAGKSLISTYSILGGGREKGGGVEVVAYLSLSWSGREVWCMWLGAYSRLGAY